MTDKEVIIDVNNCRNKSDDDCMIMPILNEYGDLLYYQSCKERTECPYKLKQKLQRLQAENEELKKKIDDYKNDRFCQGGCAVYQYDKIHKYKQALEKIEDLVTSGYLKDSRFCEAKELQQILKIINEVKDDN